MTLQFPPDIVDVICLLSASCQATSPQQATNRSLSESYFMRQQENLACFLANLRVQWTSCMTHIYMAAHRVIVIKCDYALRPSRV
uniref:Uncharacterized protein n=1 Tax=Oryza sativa subsp. japonica TaxID=39947 RepID=Q69T62_ORYSJ|nr:hypothetical protein [Oryza sativa Japonica Group]BAD35890.1 hypothetical protein [Oryza sativa Japonica Group]